MFFLWQLLVGDKAVDNVPGIDGIGPKKADKLLSGKTRNEAVEIVQHCYKKQYGDAWPEAFKECADLLWIQREAGKRCPFIGLPENLYDRT
jgi:5'-3' exonuclease